MTGIRRRAVTALCLVAAVAHADLRAVARAHFENGMKRYNLGQFDEAQRAFEEGYLARPDPVFLFNIGQCQRKLGAWEKAVGSYRAYLREVPEATNRTEVEELIREAESELDRARAARLSQHPPEAVKAPDTATLNPPPPLIVAEPPRRPAPVYKKWWLWTAVGAVAAAGVGVGLGVGLSRPGDPAVPTTLGGHFDADFSR